MAVGVMGISLVALVRNDGSEPKSIASSVEASTTVPTMPFLLPIVTQAPETTATVLATTPTTIPVVETVVVTTTIAQLPVETTVAVPPETVPPTSPPESTRPAVPNDGALSPQKCTEAGGTGVVFEKGSQTLWTYMLHTFGLTNQQMTYLANQTDMFDKFKIRHILGTGSDGKKYPECVPSLQVIQSYLVNFK
jgi:hypothetical protein